MRGEETTNRAARRMARRRRAGNLAGVSLVAATGLFGAYVGNPRLPRAYAAVSCNAYVTGGSVTDTSTLMEAIRAVNGSRCDEIDIAAPSITLFNNLPVITSSVTIKGAGSSQTVIDASGFIAFALAGRYQGVDAPTQQVLTISGLTIRNGVGTNNYYFYNGNRGTVYGGAIWAYYADAILTDVTVETSRSNGGGAVAVSSGDLHVSGGSHFANNDAYGDGGALLVEGSTTALIEDSTFTANETHGPTSRRGGAIHVEGSLTVRGSTFTGNVSAGSGGAIYNKDYTRWTSISSSTFDGNSALGAGGGGIRTEAQGIYVEDSTFTGNLAIAPAAKGGGLFSANIIVVDRSTFDGNQASKNGGGIWAGYGGNQVTNTTITGNSVYYEGSKGGGVYLSTGGFVDFSTVTGNTAETGGGIANGAGSLTIVNSIVTQNTAQGGGPDPDVTTVGAYFHPSTSIFTSESAVTPPTGGFVDVLFGDPLLGPLANNGGPTRTMMPAENSPVLGAADTAAAPATDQRGFARVVDGKADMGAVQRNAIAPTPDVTQTPPSWHQATGRLSPDAPCPGGTNPSWAQWPNGGTGGWTCEKTTWWDVTLGPTGGWVTTPGFRTVHKGSGAISTERSARVKGRSQQNSRGPGH